MDFIKKLKNIDSGSIAQDSISKLKESIKFKKGGTNKKETKQTEYDLSGNVSIIPDGVLHRERNDIPEEAHPVLGKKGIPVVDVGSKEVEKVAEIEKEELIIRKEIAKPLAELTYKYLDTKDESILLEIANMFYTEVKTNTNDHTNKFLKEEGGVNKVK